MNVEKFIFGFIGTVFTMVSIWIGATVHSLSVEIGKLSTSLENQISSNENRYNEYNKLKDLVEQIRLNQVRIEGRLNEK